MKFRHFAFFIILILLAVLLLRNGGHLEDLWRLLRQVNLLILALILPVRYGYYWANTRFYQHFYRLYHKKLSYQELFPAVISMNFLNTVIPSGGVSGLTYFTKVFEKKVTHRQALLAQSFWYIAVLASFGLVMGLSFVTLILTNSVSPASYRFVLVLALIIIFAVFLVFALSLNELVLTKALFVATRPANWVMKLLKRPVITEAHIKRFEDGYHDLVDLFRAQPRTAVRPFMDALMTIAVEIVSISIIFLAFGKLVNPAVVGMAYILAMVFSIASIFTNGVGAYEATMVAAFTALGQPLELSLSVTALYRLIAMWLFIPFGLYYYRHQTVVMPDREEG